MPGEIGTSLKYNSDYIVDALAKFSDKQIPVVIWTVSDPNVAQWLCAMGVWVITSDDLNILQNLTF